MATTWEELGARALARQFPVTPDEPGDVAAMVDGVGPMQTQTARSAFIGLAARFPGVTHAQITEAYVDARIVRGSTIRGTLHTATPQQFATLDLATRIGQRRRWTQLLGIDDAAVDDLWAATEDFAAEWRTPTEMHQHLLDWLSTHAPDAAARAADSSGRYLSLSHGGLVRRPASGIGWEGQGKPVYRTLEPVKSVTPSDIVRLHLRCHGPASRHDVAWWSGLSLSSVDAALAGLELTSHDGPDGRTYLDVPHAPAAHIPSGARLLPEFDALLCGYEPSARARFVTRQHYARLWNKANGLLRSPLLLDGRIAGYWRAMGSARRRPLEVVSFPDSRKPTMSELAEPVDALQHALGITITEVTRIRD